MNKLKAWSIVILNVFLFLVFALCLFVFVPDLFKKNIGNKDSYIASFVFLVLLILSIYGFVNGLKKVMAQKKTVVPYDKELNIQFKNQIEYKEYRNLIFGLSFKRPIILIMFGLILLNIINIFTKSNISYIYQDFIFPMILCISVVLFIPLIVYYKTRQIYKSSELFHENINYSLDNNSVKMNGETFDSELKWTHFYKIKETKNFFMLYHGKTIATLLGKNSMNNVDVVEFKLFIKSLKMNQE
jgi:hypothetical protein